MENNTNTVPSNEHSGTKDNITGNSLVSPEDDGRSKEWQDRARVNLEQVPEGTKTILERDFEPEHLDNDQAGGKSADAGTPAY